MALSTSIQNLLFGRPLATSEERAEHIGPVAGIPVFGLDALSSAAYGPEAALTLLVPLGMMGVHYIVPVSAAIVALLTIVYFSYRQTIDAYPHGGGSYTVASQNLGEGAGLLAAGAHVDDGENDQDAETQFKRVGLQPRHGRDEGAYTGRDAHRRGEHIVDHQRTRGQMCIRDRAPPEACCLWLRQSR